jgi:hypothetical protein
MQSSITHQGAPGEADHVEQATLSVLPDHVVRTSYLEDHAPTGAGASVVLLEEVLSEDDVLSPLGVAVVVASAGLAVVVGSASSPQATTKGTSINTTRRSAKNFFTVKTSLIIFCARNFAIHIILNVAQKSKMFLKIFLYFVLKFEIFLRNLFF